MSAPSRSSGTASSYPWSWSDVSVTDPDVQQWDRQFAAKDVGVLYVVTLTLVAMMWALIITVFAVDDVNARLDVIVTVFSFSMVALALGITVRRLWIIKFYMLHPALSRLYDRPGAAFSDVHNGRRMLAGMVVTFVAGIAVLVAGGICLVVGANTRGAGVGLCVGTTALFILSGTFYRLHACSFLARVKTTLLHSAAPP